MESALRSQGSFNGPQFSASAPKSAFRDLSVLAILIDVTGERQTRAGAADLARTPASAAARVTCRARKIIPICLSSRGGLSLDAVMVGCAPSNWCFNRSREASNPIKAELRLIFRAPRLRRFGVRPPSQIGFVSSELVCAISLLESGFLQQSQTGALDSTTVARSLLR
jgi:hypothetical protein